MHGKLALRNIRRSAKDYAVYFITLVCGVAVFYAFNSIGSQQVLADVTADNSSFVDAVKYLISLFSILVASVLGFLVLYANRFLIRRRKQEMGTYLLLGMKPSQVAGIVLLETIIVGVFSFAVGAAVGIILSQGLSFVTAALFNTVLDEYQFEFSSQALAFTAICYALIFLVVALFNTLQVSRCKLINLLSARSANEKITMRSLPACVIVFLLSLVLIGYSYHLLDLNGFLELADREFVLSTISMLIGTLLLFWSVAGFVIAVIQRTRSIYFTGLAMFNMRQIASRINTAFVSLWAVCVLLFFGITVFTNGIGLGEMFIKCLDKSAPYDASIIASVYLDNPQYNASLAEACKDPEIAAETKERARFTESRYESSNGDIAKYFDDRSDIWGEIVGESAQIDIYLDEQLKINNLLDLSGHSDLTKAGGASSEFLIGIADENVLLIGQSQMNDLLRLAGKETIDLGKTGYIVNNNVDMFQDVADDLVRKTVAIEIAGYKLKPVGSCLSVATMNMATPVDALNIVVPDEVVDILRSQSSMPYASYLNITYVKGLTEADEQLQAAMIQALPVDSSDEQGEFYTVSDEADQEWVDSAWPATMQFTKNQIHDSASSIRVLSTYLAIYIGFVLLIAVAAVLAIQQLSEASDSVGRYRVLAQLGCSRRQIMSSLFIQVIVYFLAPLSLAVVHSACAIYVLSNSLFNVWGVSIMDAVIATACLLLVLYGGYMLVTYLTARNVLKSSLGKELLG